MRSRLPLVATLLSLLGCQPLGPISGGTLSGQITPPPADWTQLDEVEVIQLETRPDDPYSVNLWGVAVGESYYIGSGTGGEATWVEHITADPKVRLRIGDAIYELWAVRIEKDSELEAVRQHYLEKYRADPDAEEWEAAWFYRLDRR